MIELRECIEKLACEDEADRMYAAEDIGFANQVEGVQALLARLPVEPSRAVREAIFAALQQIEGDAVIEGVLVLLDSEDSYLRNETVEILRARGARVLPCLERAFNSGESDRRKFIVDILGKVSDTGTSGIYDRALADTDLNVVITAVESLGARRMVAFREQVENLISTEGHPMLNCACIEALAQIGEGSSVTTVRGRLGAEQEIPAYLQASYLKLLGAKGGPEAIHEIARLSGRDELEEHTLNALTSLRSRYRNLDIPEDLMRPLQNVVNSGHSPISAYQAVRLLGNLLRIEEVFGFVSGCLEHPETAVRIAAVQALREAEPGRAEDILKNRRLRETDEEVLQALGR